MPRRRSAAGLTAALATAALFLGVLGSGACGPNEQVSRKATPRLDHRNPARGVAKIGEIHALYGPESVRYDPELDVFFISNVLGFGSVKDNAGYIVRVNAAGLGEMDVFAESGRNGVELHAPKGLALQGDTLWAADIDVLRGFHRRTGRPVGEIDLRGAGAVLLNDVAIGPNGELYVTDTGIIMSPKGVIYAGGEKIFRIGRGRTVSLLASGHGLKYPNGITWSAENNRWVVVSYDPFNSELYTLDAQGGQKAVLARGKGEFDGVELLRGGAALVTSWKDSSLHLFRKSESTILIPHIPSPADLGVDTRRNRVAIPLLKGDKVLFYQLSAPAL